MPHRAGYFVYAYQWDHHCHDLIESIKGKFHHMLRELGELEYQDVWDPESLLNYFKKWHYNNELYHRTIDEIDKKQFVINQLGYRGYGVNIDLLNALEGVKKKYAEQIYNLLDERFRKHLKFVKKIIRIKKVHIDSFDSRFIISKLCKKLKRKPEENIPYAYKPVELELEYFFQIMSNETPWTVNTAIFQRLFFSLGVSSMTIMKGTVGHHDELTAQDLKIIGNKNFIEMYNETFSNLHTFTDIGIDLMKKIHYILSKDIDPNAGNYRTLDFPDRNGVTLEFGNFEREIGDLAHVLYETGQSFNNLDAFIYDLSRSYYMFLGIHPFWDSNGRVGKCFMNHMLLKKGIPPISFNEKEEILALPRYGGSMDDMHEYIKKRIQKSVDSYFYEREKLDYFGFLSNQIYNVSFDSGVYFRQIDTKPQKLEVNFHAYLIDEGNPLSKQYNDQCRITFPNEYLLYNMTVYCGFSHAGQTEWEHIFNSKNSIYIKEISSDIEGIRIYDVDFIIELQEYHFNYDYFNCCVISDEGGLIFNNKELNYSYKIMR